MEPDEVEEKIKEAQEGLERNSVKNQIICTIAMLVVASFFMIPLWHGFTHAREETKILYIVFAAVIWGAVLAIPIMGIGWSREGYRDELEYYKSQK